MWKIILNDNKEISEQETEWSSISTPIEVKYLDRKKMVHICTLPVKNIKCILENLETEIEVTEDCFVYQATRGEALIIKDISRKDRVLGKIIGLVRNNEVVEEKYINAIEQKIEGFKL